MSGDDQKVKNRKSSPSFSKGPPPPAAPNGESGSTGRDESGASTVLSGPESKGRLQRSDSEGLGDPRVLTCVFEILVGCGINVVFLELITKRDPGAGGLVTLAQFVFVALMGLGDAFEMNGWRIRLRARKVPLWTHVAVTALFFVVNLMNNAALGYGISMPLHMLFRSSSLGASMLLGWLGFGKSYKGRQIQGVLLVSLGIIFTTAADARYKMSVAASGKSCCQDGGQDGGRNFGDSCKGERSCQSQGGQDNASEQEQDDAFMTWLFGLGMLTCALFLSAALGQVQEILYKRYGGISSELKFYSHCLALPYFLLFQYGSLATRIQDWNQSETLFEVLSKARPDALQMVENLGMGYFIKIPLLWILLLCNVASQLYCVSGVYRLTAISSSLTTTMAVTFRKFLSIIVSVWYFDNPFSKLHMVGTLLTFTGVGVYFHVGQFFPSSQDLNNSVNSSRDKKTK